jgi:hypothetical protein
MANTAKTLSSIAPLSTLYCPIVDLPQNLPSYLTVDLQSEWSKSALIASAIETATLPARLRSYRNFESSLMGHSGGTQTIFELQSSVIGNHARRPRWVTNEDELNGLDEDAKLDFDLNLTIPQPMRDDTTVFTQSQVFRGEREKPADDDDTSPVEEIGLARRMRLYASKPALTR